MMIEIKRHKKTSFTNKFVEFLEEGFLEEYSDEKIQIISKALESARFGVLVEKIKTAIHQLIYHTGSDSNQDISDYISEKVNRGYIFLNKIFMQHTGISIKSYLNLQKIELIKELLIYDELNIATIARKLNYRSETNLVEVFRKETGVSPAFYRLLRKTSSYEYKNV